MVGALAAWGAGLFAPKFDRVAVSSSPRAVGTPSRLAAPAPQAMSVLPTVGPKLAIDPVLDVEAPAVRRLRIGVGGRDGLPAGAHLRVQGLPADVMLSAGVSDAEHMWTVPLRAIEDLVIEVPPRPAGDHDLLIALVDGDGAVIDEHSARLHVRQPGSALPRGLPPPRSIMAELPNAGEEAQASGFPLAQPPSAATTPLRSLNLRPRESTSSAMPTIEHGNRFRAGALPSADLPAPARAAGSASAPSSGASSTQSRGPHPNAPTRPRDSTRSTVPAVDPGKPAGVAGNEPDRKRCVADGRPPCNVGNPDGWWLWRALADLARRP
jgi:hypothetical protein